MSGQRAFFPPVSNGGPAPSQPTPFMGFPMQQQFIAQNNYLAAQASIMQAASSGVPTSIIRVGANGMPATTLLSSSTIPLPLPRTADPAATNTPKDEEYEWIEYFNQDGKAYYHNKTTKITTWNKPDRFKPGVQSAITSQKSVNSPAGPKKVWKEYKNEEGRSYYHNHETKETTWTKPPDFDDVVEKVKLSPIIDPIPRAVAALVPSEMPVSIDLSDIPTPFDLNSIDVPKTTKSDMEKAMEATLKSLVVPAKPAPVEIIEDPAELKQKNTEKFKQMLLDKYGDGRIKTSMTWDQALRQFQHDSRFKLLVKMSEKKRIFNEWKTQQQKDERDARKLAARKAKEDFEEFLLNDKRFLPTMVYSKAERLFGTEDVWKALGDSDKRDIYKDTIPILRRKRDEAAREVRQKCRGMLVDLIDSLPNITYKTTWAEAQKTISSCKAFVEHPQLKRMHKLEMLEAFEDYNRKAEKQHFTEVGQEEKMTKRSQRKVRDAFHDLMAELKQKGSILSTTKWTQIYPIIRQDTRFNTMLMQPGSTPLDIFKFFVEDLKIRYSKDRKRIREIIQKQDIKVTIEMPYSEFEQQIREEDKSNEIDATHLNLYFTHLLDKCSAPTDTNEENGHDNSKEKKVKKERKSKKEKKAKKDKKKKRSREREMTEERSRSSFKEDEHDNNGVEMEVDE